MKKVIDTFELDKEKSNLIQGASLEASGYERLLMAAMADNGYDIPEEKMKFLFDMYNDSFMKYEKLKQEITSQVSAKYGDNTEWSLDFESSVITIKQ